MKHGMSANRIRKKAGKLHVIRSLFFMMVVGAIFSLLPQDALCEYPPPEVTIDVKCEKVGPSSHKLSVNVGMSCFFSNERFIYKFYFSDGTSFARVVEFPAFEYTSTALLRHLESLEVGIFTGEFVEPWWSDKIAIDCAP